MAINRHCHTHYEGAMSVDSRLNILVALHEQVFRWDVGREPMSPTERHLANAILVMLNVLIDERKHQQKP
jgi:hypothetical protein